MNTHDRTLLGAGHTFILILIFVIMSAGIIMTGYGYYLNYDQDFRAELESELSGIAELKVSGLTLWRKERLGDGAVLFKNVTFSALVRRFLGKPEDLEAQRQLRNWIDKYHASNQYAQVSLFDTEGTQRMSVPEATGPADSFVAHNGAQILRGGKVVFQDFHRDAPGLPIHLAVMVPIFDEADNRPLGVLVLNIDPTTYLYSFISRWPTPSQTAETLLVRRDGDDVLFLNEVKFQKNAPLNLRIPLTQTDVPTVKAALGQRGIVLGVGYDGAPVTAAVFAVPDSPWCLVAKINIAEEYAPVKKRMLETLAFVGVLILGSALAMGFVWRERSARFYREQYKVAAELNKSDDKIKLLLDSMGEAMYGVDLDGNCTFANLSCLRILGYQDASQVMGKNMHDLIHHSRNDGSPYPIEQCKIYEAFREGAGTHVDDEVLWRADGSSFPAEYRSFPTWFGGKTTGSVVTFTDITNRKKVENELVSAKNMAEEATRLKDKFVALVAHDLRSPFASMMGLLRLLLERKQAYFEDEESKNISDRIFKNGDRMVAMIDQLLKISRLQTGKIAPHPRFFKAHMAAAVTIGALNHSATQKGIVIINEVPVDMRLYADSALFDEVLLNLLSNAIKFCSCGDRITVFAPVGLKSAIAVQDTGKGIETKMIPNLFKHEITTSTRGTDGETGTGLGLPFSLDIMKAHGGDIAVESAPGKGSAFCAILPYIKPLALVVDDDPDFMLVIKGYLEKVGVDVAEAYDGEQALAFLKERRPHIIILDIIMPVMDGYTLLDRLKKDSATRGIPVIVMTFADRDSHEKAVRCGADDFVGKPLEVEDFIPRVRRFVG